MIEVIYKGEHKGDKDGEAQVALPKNIRQIGEGGQDRKIYIEDYAVTYMHQLANDRKEGTQRAAAILLGEVQRAGKNRYIFINGALAVDELDFGEEMWDKVQQQMMEYFDGREIVGWYLGEEESTLIATEEMQRIHESQFPGEDQILILRDFTENESAVFALESGRLVAQRGYYIYYEKNIMMQEYMVACNKDRSVEEETEVKDDAVQSFRKKIAEEKKEKKEKQENKESDKQPITTKLLYAASSFLVLTVLIIGVTLINNYDKMKDMEMALAGISESMGSKGTGAEGSTDSVSAMAPAQTKTEKEQSVSEKNAAIDKNKAGSSKETEPQPATEEAKGNKETEAAKDDAEQTKSDAANSTEASKDSNAAASESNAGQSSQVQQDGQANQDAQANQDGQANQNAQAGQQDKTSQAQQTDAQNQTDPAKQPARETMGRASYVVKDGDTLATISEMYYGTLDKVEDICSLNGITDKNTILPGQKIVLP